MGPQARLDPALLRAIAKLLRKARRVHGLAHAATILRAAVREARADRRHEKDSEQR